jgi:geranylgeranylglycerol-phosphate geranylgeranyltransferase
LSKLSAYVALARPFTLLAPAMGMLAYGLAAAGYGGSFEPTHADVHHILLGAFVAALLNVASNAVNQIFDIEIDRTNKPDRPLPSGALSIGEAWVVTIVGYAGSIAVAAFIHPTLLWIVAFTALMTYAYSGPPFRTKRHWAFANITIATPRGFLLPVAGWMAVALPRGDAIPNDLWILAGASGLFVLGAATTKDYADMEGDRAGGCITLPLRFGVEKSVNIVAPFLVVPWLLVAVAAALGHLAGNHFVLFWGSIVLGVVGMRAVRLLVRDPQALTGKSTHPSWVLMYLLMVFSQVMAALAYALPPNFGARFAP